MTRDELILQLSNIPSIEQYLDDLHVNSLEEPDLETNHVIRECLGVLVKELEEYGITFYCDLNDLTSNFFEGAYLLDLYNNFRPHLILKGTIPESAYVTMINQFCTYDVDNVLLTALEYLSTNAVEGDYYPVDRFVFFKDKLKSTEQFNELVATDIAVTALEAINPFIHMSFLGLISAQTDGLKRFFQQVFNDDLIEMTPREADLIIRDFRSDLITSDKFGLVTMTPEPHRSGLVVKISHREIEGTDYSASELVTVILNRVSDHKLFGIPLPDTLTDNPEYVTLLAHAMDTIPDTAFSPELS